MFDRRTDDPADTADLLVFPASDLRTFGSGKFAVQPFQRKCQQRQGIRTLGIPDQLIGEIGCDVQRQGSLGVALAGPSITALNSDTGMAGRLNSTGDICCNMG